MSGVEQATPNGSPLYEPPVALEQMRKVANGWPPEPGDWLWLRKLFRQNPERFVDRMTRLETAYAQSLAKATEAAPSVTPDALPIQERERSVTETIDRLLEEWKRENRNVSAEPG